MKISRILFLLAFLGVFPGCLDLDSLETRIDLQSDLSGKLLITGKGIRSSKEGIKEQKKEMQDFLAKDLVEIRQNVEQSGLENVRTHSFCETALRCHAVLVASFDNLLSTLWFITDNQDLKIIRHNDTLEVAFPNPGTDHGQYLTLRYQGKVLSHNGIRQAPDTLRWKYSDQSSKGVRFVLALD